VEFCLALPPEFKLRNGLNRWILRESMRDLLPEEIRRRAGKADFRPNFRESLQRSGDALRDVVFRRSRVLDGWIDRRLLLKAYEKVERGSPHTGDLWAAVTLTLWMEKGVDAEVDLVVESHSKGGSENAE
jgi:asparagine synthase (glutamine-hydrolysing)